MVVLGVKSFYITEAMDFKGFNSRVLHNYTVSDKHPEPKWSGHVKPAFQPAVVFFSETFSYCQLHTVGVANFDGVR